MSDDTSTTEFVHNLSAKPVYLVLTTGPVEVMAHVDAHTLARWHECSESKIVHRSSLIGKRKRQTWVRLAEPWLGRAGNGPTSVAPEKQELRFRKRTVLHVNQLDETPGRGPVSGMKGGMWVIEKENQTVVCECTKEGVQRAYNTRDRQNSKRRRRPRAGKSRDKQTFKTPETLKPVYQEHQQNARDALQSTTHPPRTQTKHKLNSSSLRTYTFFAFSHPPPQNFLRTRISVDCAQGQFFSSELVAETRDDNTERRQRRTEQKRTKQSLKGGTFLRAAAAAPHHSASGAPMINPRRCRWCCWCCCFFRDPRSARTPPCC